jgi:predicted nucleic acid-binding protein
LSEVIRGRNERVRRNSLEYPSTYGRFTFSIITRYEILRGLKSRDAEQQLARFEAECLVTNNTAHFQRVPGLVLANWRNITH